MSVATSYKEPVASNENRLEEAVADYAAIGKILRVGKRMDLREILVWTSRHAEDLGPQTVVVNTDKAADLKALAIRSPKLLLNQMGLTFVRHLNTLLNTANEVLAPGGYLWCHSRTSGLKKQLFLEAHPGGWGRFLYDLHFLWHRVFARLKLTRWFYMWVTDGKNRSYTRVELLGRMYRAGFEVIEERFHEGEYFILGRKVKEPVWDDDPSNGIIVKLNRVGYHGKTIGVYKFRTMYPYSEYLQPYLYENEGLARGGKFAHDYRVNWLGRRIRGSWIDELPMLANLLKGQIKLVGVRPLSAQYLSLYTPEMQELHTSVKPGLLPPFYYEQKNPETIEEVQASEKRYIEAYHRRPFATDWRYFWGIVGNILFKHRRSK